MAPTVILIRHAEAVHNPPLTELGFGPQCEELSYFLRNKVPLASQIELIVASPLRRTLQTATQTFGWLIEKGVPIHLLAEWQENSDAPCDTGSEISIMKKEWPQYDWSTVDPLFPAKTGLYAYTIEALTKRGLEARKWLKQRPEKVIAVVSHSSYLRGPISGKKYANADFRIFDFVEGNDARLVEWESTESKGGGLGKSQKGVWGFRPDIPLAEPKLVEVFTASRGPTVGHFEEEVRA